MGIEVKNLCFSYNNTPVLKGLDFCTRDGQLIAVIGPNGVGKTTLFRCLLGFLKPTEGNVLVDGRPIEDYSRKELAKHIAYVPQNYRPAFNHTVVDSVLMGLTSSLGIFDVPSDSGKKKAIDILKSLGISHLSDRGCMKISGGEQQLMLLGRALIQDAKVLIMDEPTANLDFGNNYRVMQQISALKSKGYTVIFSTHDPNQAIRWSDRIICISDGKIIADGDNRILTGEVLKKLYGVDVTVCDECKSVAVL